MGLEPSSWLIYSTCEESLVRLRLVELMSLGFDIGYAWANAIFCLGYVKWYKMSLFDSGLAKLWLAGSWNLLLGSVEVIMLFSIQRNRRPVGLLSFEIESEDEFVFRFKFGVW